MWTDHVLFIDSSANDSALFPPPGCWNICDDTCGLVRTSVCAQACGAGGRLSDIPEQPPGPPAAADPVGVKP